MAISDDTATPKVAIGVDGWRKGWVAVALTDGAFERAWSSSLLQGIVDAAPEASVFGVDIPIGLPANPPREADAAARSFVGERRSSVFPALPSQVVAADSYEEALRIHEQLFRKGISKQAYALRSRILEADLIARVDGRVVEVHPEVSFAAMAGTTLAWSKRTWNGLQLRVSLLRKVGVELPEQVDAGAEVPPEDMVDAGAAAWSAARYAEGMAESLPRVPPTQNGRKVAIWY